MFRKCKYCNREFFGKEYFCSELCEIKNYASEIRIYEKHTITPETKEEFNRDREGLTETP